MPRLSSSTSDEWRLTVKNQEMSKQEENDDIKETTQREYTTKLNNQVIGAIDANTPLKDLECASAISGFSSIALRNENSASCN